MLILTVYSLEDDSWLSVVFIMVGMIFCVLCAYEFYNFEWFYVGYNTTVGNSTPYIYNTFDYAQPYGFVFLLLFFIFAALFVKAGSNAWKESLRQQGEMEFKKMRKR